MYLNLNEDFDKNLLYKGKSVMIFSLFEMFKKKNNCIFFLV